MFPDRLYCRITVIRLDAAPPPLPQERAERVAVYLLIIDDQNGDGPKLADVDNYPFGWSTGGGQGDDTYYCDDAGDVIVAAARMPRPPASLVADVRLAPETHPIPV